MDDHTAQFYVMVGAICDQARLGQIAVRFALDDGSVVEGIPASPSPAPADAELDQTGYRCDISVGTTPIHLPAVREVAFARPTPGSSGPRIPGASSLPRTPE